MAGHAGQGGMKALRAFATALLAAFTLSAGLAAEALALARFTALNPGFYGTPERAAYDLAARVAVRKIADAVLERVPPVALRTTDEQDACKLAGEALPPDRIAALMEESGPDVARYFISGGPVPVLAGSSEIEDGAVSAAKSLLMNGIWDSLPKKPVLAAFMPFTPEWNMNYAAGLSSSLGGFRSTARWAGAAAVTLVCFAVCFAGLMALLWRGQMRVFLGVCGGLFAGNALLLLVLAAAVSFFCGPISQALAGVPSLQGASALFAGDFTELVRTVLWPFRGICLAASAVSLSFSLMLATLGRSAMKEATRHATGAVRKTREKPEPYEGRHVRKQPAEK